MAQMTIDSDIKEALDDGRITWAEAGELRELRKSRAKWQKAVNKVQAEINSLAETHPKFTTLTAKLNGTPVATEPDPHRNTTLGTE